MLEATCGETARKVACILGGLSTLFIGSHFLILGNLGMYVESYLVERVGMEGDRPWFIPAILACSLVTASLVMPLAGLLDRRLGPAATGALGLTVIMWVFGVSRALCCWTVQVSVWGTVFTYGILPGVGFGLYYASPYSAVNKHRFKHPGAMYGVVSAGFGVGSMIYNLLLTVFINPDNSPPTAGTEEFKYFSREEILDKIPYAFLLLAATNLVVMPVAVFGLWVPPVCHCPHYLPFSETTEQVENDGTSPLANNSCDRHDHTGPCPTPPATEGWEEGGGGETTESVGETREGVELRQLLKSPHFYWLWGFTLVSGILNYYSAGFYKKLGMTHIPDDVYMATLGSVAPVTGALLRPLWGLCVDRSDMKNTMVLQSGGMCLLLVFWYYSTQFGPVVYFLWTCLVYGFSASFNVLTSMAVKSYYGTLNFSAILGCLWSALAVGAMVLPFVTTFTLDNFGWSVYILILAFLAFLGLVCALLLPDPPSANL